MQADSIILVAPDDWHIHLRDGKALQRTVHDAARQFNRAVVMPNLVPPVTTCEQALAYRARILEHASAGSAFTPLMTLYLTDNTPVSEVNKAALEGITAFKLYPAGATTNSDAGVSQIEKAFAAIEAMAENGLPLLVHGEVTRPEIDIFDREARFIEEVLVPLRARFPSLKIVLEHITTRDAVEFVHSQERNTAATITAHHLLFNRNHMLVGGIKPHYYCLPVLKRNIHQQALIDAATSGDPRFFIGTDSAPHARSAKESACGCAGSYTAFAAIELYAQAFDQANALDKLEGFSSRFGANFYGLPVNDMKIELVRERWRVPHTFDYLDEHIVPLMAGEALDWRVREIS